MEAVTNLSVSVMLFLSGAFSDGLERLEEKAYPASIQSFTKVIEYKGEDENFKPLAYYFRAQAHQAQEQTEAARADLAILYKTTPKKEMRKISKALYVMWGGKGEDLLPKMGPLKMWGEFGKKLMEGDFIGAKAMCIGEWIKIMEDYTRREAMGRGNKIQLAQRYFRQLNDQILDGQHLGKGPTDGQAWLVYTKPNVSNNRFVTEIGFTLDRDRWFLSSVNYTSADQLRHGEKVEAESQKIFNQLTQLKFGLKKYATSHEGRYPKNMETVRKLYLTDESAAIWEDPKTKKQIPFLYCPSRMVSDPVDTILLAEPVTRDDRRYILQMDGLIHRVSEETFKKMALKQRWALPGLFEKNAISKEKTDEIENLVKILREGSLGERRKARQKLENLELSGYSLLHKFKDDEDPEIRATIRKILGRRP